VHYQSCKYPKRSEVMIQVSSHRHLASFTLRTCMQLANKRSPGLCGLVKRTAPHCFANASCVQMRTLPGVYFISTAKVGGSVTRAGRGPRHCRCLRRSPRPKKSVGIDGALRNVPSDAVAEAKLLFRPSPFVVQSLEFSRGRYRQQAVAAAKRGRMPAVRGRHSRPNQ